MPKLIATAFVTLLLVTGVHASGQESTTNTTEPLEKLSATEDTLAPSTEAKESTPPTIYIAGDSTAANGVPSAVGWGLQFGDYFKTPVVNFARGGTSSRTYFQSETFEKLIAKLTPGDIVLIQFGHNDGGAINGDKVARGSLRGVGDETEDIVNGVTGQPETVHTFGHYLRELIAAIRDKKAQPILLSLTVRNIWKDGKVERGSGNYGNWSREVAESQRVPFIDATKLIADHYEALGPDKVADFFPRDPTHTSAAGAALNGQLILSGLKGLREQSIHRLLSNAGRMIPTASPDAVLTFSPRHDRNNAQERYQWLNLSVPADPQLPSLVLIGDSTVRNGRGDGSNGQFGWGDPLENHFDLSKINVVNRAIGGLGARTFRDTQNYREVLELLKPGDVVLIQFGHNDNGPRGPVKGIGENTEERSTKADGSAEEQVVEVHTFGWYLRQYIHEIRDRGATPILCSLVPRNIWKDERILRWPDGHADWTKQIAEQERVPFVDLHEIIASKYDTMGKDAVDALFADERVHTNWPGAVINARAVAEGLRQLSPNPLAKFIKE